MTHFTIPSTELTDEAGASYAATHPQVKEMFQRFLISYHASDGFFSYPDHNLMGYHIEEAVYAPLYYGYGGPDSGSPMRSPEGQRTKMARSTEEEILRHAPNMVLVLMKATPEVIRERMAANFYRTPRPSNARGCRSSSESPPGVWCWRKTWNMCWRASKRSSRRA